MRTMLTRFEFFLLVWALGATGASVYLRSEVVRWEAVSLDHMNSSIKEHEIAENRFWEIGDLKIERDRYKRQVASSDPYAGLGPVIPIQKRQP